MEPSALCPICFSDSQEHLPYQRARQHDPCAVVRCASCHFIYRTMPPAAPAAAQPAVDRRSDEQIIRQLTMVEQAVGCGNLLDIGCGSGRFLEHAFRHGWQVAGVGDQAAPLRHVPVHPELSEGIWPAGAFDAVTIWGGLERSAQPESLLRMAAHYCRLDGVLALQLANGDSKQVREEMPDTTARCYSPLAAHRLLSRYGFRTECIAPATPNETRAPRWLITIARYTP